jgi:hypothetical protein
LDAVIRGLAKDNAMQATFRAFLDSTNRQVTGEPAPRKAAKRGAVKTQDIDTQPKQGVDSDNPGA